jgi:hypothetical protein
MAANQKTKIKNKETHFGVIDHRKLKIMKVYWPLLV